MQAKEIKPGAVLNYNGAPVLIETVSVQTPSARGAATLYKFRGRHLVTKQKTDITLKGGESLGIEPGDRSFLGIGIDLGGDGARGPDEPHFEINQDSDPGLEPSLAVSVEIPDVLSTGPAGATVRITALLENDRLRVLAAADHDP